jgi:hypothetical protein
VRRALLAAIAALTFAPAPAQADLKAGTATVDATWHVGASAGQYASNRAESTDRDPHLHQFKNAPSYGVQSRLQMRAVVVEGARNPDQRRGANRFALVKADLYIPQDLLYRRAAQLIAEKGVEGITRENLVMAVTHDHSSPYYTSTAWGAWSFQDVFDLRAYEYYAERIAEAVKQASDDMRAVKVGAAAVQLDAVHRNSMGPELADDGTPAGAPYSYTDHELAVVRFDDVSDPNHPKPYAVIANYSNHPEGLDGNDLISADWIAAFERMVDRATGATTVYTQNAVGHSEMERSTHHHPRERHEYYHREYAQGERAARLTADAAITAYKQVETKPKVPFQDDPIVDFHDKWFPGPLTHPYPSVSNCRTDAVAQAPPDPRVPIVGLPDCTGPSAAFSELPFSELPVPVNAPGLTYDQLKQAGIPVPDNYGAPSFTGLQEDVSVHLQGFRIGDIFFPVCSCEQWADQSLNLKARTDRVARNETLGDNLGYDWSTQCTPADGSWQCPDPNSKDKLITVAPEKFERMRAQVRNDAFGWNATTYAPYAESEPADPSQIKGNFTHDDNLTSAALGYGLTVPISMANDYNGYIVSYREYQQGDHYRKALAGWGPHSSDYMTTRLVKLGRLMQGGPDLDETIRDASGNDVGRDGVIDPDADNVAFEAKTTLDIRQNDERAAALGRTARAATQAYEAGLPDDAQPEIERQPQDLERFDLASLTWKGGSNYTDNPLVTVERKEGGTWRTAAEPSGEIVTTLRLPSATDVPAHRVSAQPWRWTAHFETFSSDIDTGGGDATKPGTYRFVVDGHRRTGGRAEPYRLTSEEFRVGEWSGITVEDIRREASGRISFRVGPRRRGVRHTDFDGRKPLELPNELGPIDYPDSYAKGREEHARFVKEERSYAPDPEARDDTARFQLYCLHCSFRPWADLGDATRATVTFAAANGRVTRVAARHVGDRWITTRRLRRGEGAYVCPADVRDRWDNFNGAASDVVGRRPARLSCAGAGARRAGRAATLRLRASRRCVGRRGLRLRVAPPRRGLTLRTVTISIDGRRVRTLRGTRTGSLVVLRPRGRAFMVTVRARASDGRTYTTRRLFRACRQSPRFTG